MKRVVWVLIALAVVAGGVISIMGQRLVVEVGAVATNTPVREYIAEDGTTRLAREYTVDMPVSGTVQRLALEVGDAVKKGDVIAQVDTYDLEQRIREVQALILQTKARVTGVDVAKPKTEDIDSAEIQAKEMSDALQITRRSKAVITHNLTEARKAYERAISLIEDGAVSASYMESAEARYKGLQEELNRAELQEKAAEKQLRMAELSHQRLAGSIDDNEYMREEFQAQIDVYNAQLALLHNDLEKTEVHAPVSGPVLEKFVENRRVLAAGSALLRIGDLTSLEIECDVLSEEVSAVAEGQRVEVTGKALRGEMLMGTVSRIYPSGFMKVSALGVEQQRVKTLIQFDADNVPLRPGTSVDIKVVTAEVKDATVVPDRAVFRKDGEWHVFTVSGGKAELRTVQIGLKNEEWVEILEGLPSDAEIVLDPKNEMTDGMHVRTISSSD